MKNVEDVKSIYQLSADIKKAEMNLKRLREECAVLIAKVEEQEKEVTQWSPVGGDFFINVDGSVDEGHTEEEMRLFGLERPTEQQAERAAVEMRKFNRLLALRDELCGDEVVDWESKITDKWRVYRDNRAGEWNVGKNQYMQDVGVYFTKEEHAQRACNMLNSGEVEL